MRIFGSASSETIVVALVSRSASIIVLGLFHARVIRIARSRASTRTRNTTAVPRLRVRLVLDHAVALRGTSSHRASSSSASRRGGSHRAGSRSKRQRSKRIDFTLSGFGYNRQNIIYPNTTVKQTRLSFVIKQGHMGNIVKQNTRSR